jgi:hypothetical protein
MDKATNAIELVIKALYPTSNGIGTSCKFIFQSTLLKANSVNDSIRKIILGVFLKTELEFESDKPLGFVR